MEMFCFLVRFLYQNLDVVSFRTLPAKLIFKFKLGSGCIAPATLRLSSSFQLQLQHQMQLRDFCYSWIVNEVVRFKYQMM